MKCTCWNTAGALHSLKCMTLNSNSPHLVLNAVFHLSPAFMCMRLYPLCRLNLENILELRNRSIVLSVCRSTNYWICRAKKCEFHVKEMEWLGVHVNENGFRMDQWKTEAINDWKTPKNVTDIRSFLGFVNFY